MPTKVTIAQLKARMAGDLDAYAFELLPPDSFVLHACDTKPYPEEIRRCIPPPRLTGTSASAGA